MIPDSQINIRPPFDAPTHQSLQNLLDAEGVHQLGSWETKGNIDLDSGRLVVKAGTGSVWSTSKLVNSRDEWTLELVFRNSEVQDEQDHSYYDTNGFAFWLLQESTSSDLKRDVSNFGGPSVFDGLQILVNNKDVTGVKVFASDGTKEIENSLSSAVGACAVHYLDLMIPFTLRLSYSSEQKWFKVQMDNNLCFKTDQISFQNLKEDFLFGVSAAVHPDSKEYWEIFKLNVYEGLTSDAVDDHGIIAEAKELKEVLPSSNRESLMERTRKMKEELEKGEEHGKGDERDKTDVASKLSAIEAFLQRLSEPAPATDEAGVSQIGAILNEVKRDVSEIKREFLELKSFFNEANDLRRSQEAVLLEIKSATQALSEMRRDVIDMKRHTNEVGSKVDLILHIKAPEMPDAFNKIVKWILFPVVIGISLLAIVVYRLRKDIKHSKLL